MMWRSVSMRTRARRECMPAVSDTAGPGYRVRCPVTALDDAFRPWLDCLLRSTGPLALYDAHTHIGQNDPDGFKQTADELVEGLAVAGARGVVFPMHEPGGYPAANDAAISAAAAHPERLVAFCRLDPRDG